jgi:hypothetical protein
VLRRQGTMSAPGLCPCRARSSVGEHSPYKRGVAGSKPAAPTTVHVGTPSTSNIVAVRTTVADTKWLRVSLWCPRKVAEERIVERDATFVEIAPGVWRHAKTDTVREG